MLSKHPHAELSHFIPLNISLSEQVKAGKETNLHCGMFSISNLHSTKPRSGIRTLNCQTCMELHQSSPGRKQMARNPLAMDHTTEARPQERVLPSDRQNSRPTNNEGWGPVHALGIDMWTWGKPHWLPAVLNGLKGILCSYFREGGWWDQALVWWAQAHEEGLHADAILGIIQPWMKHMFDTQYRRPHSNSHGDFLHR